MGKGVLGPYIWLLVVILVADCVVCLRKRVEWRKILFGQ